MDMSRLAGRVAVVTGAGGGLGTAICEDLVQAGLKVVGIELDNINNVKEMAARLVSPGPLPASSGTPGSLHPLHVDITDDVELRAAFQWIQDNLGAVSVIVNNAGVVRMKPIEETENSDISAILNTNVLGLIAATREAIKSMNSNNISDGHIININSTVGHPECVTRTWTNMYHAGVYAASKHAVSGLSQALRAEMWGQDLKIRVTDLSPGTVRTPLVKEEFLVASDYRVLLPADVSRVVRFVLSSPPSVEIVHLMIQPTGEVW